MHGKYCTHKYSMLLEDIITEDKTTQSIISLLRKTPKVTSPLDQFKNDPNGWHRKCRLDFRRWAERAGLKFIKQAVFNRGGANIAMYTLFGMMQKECGLPVTGILDVATMRGFAKNVDKFNDAYISSRVESAIASSGIKVPRGCIDVVKAIENTTSAWGSTYASYHDINNRLRHGIGPGQVEPTTYRQDVKGSFDFGNFNHVTSIDMLTMAMLETIVRKMRIADSYAKKEGTENTTLEQFARAWNNVNYTKAKGVYANKTMRKVVKPVKVPPPAPVTIDQTAIDKAVNKALGKPPNAPVDKTDDSYISKLKKAFGSAWRNYWDSDATEDIDENFADGKVKGKSKPGRVKKSGASCNGSVTDLRKRAKNASGEKAKMYHWCANMKSGKKK